MKSFHSPRLPLMTSSRLGAMIPAYLILGMTLWLVHPVEAESSAIRSTALSAADPVASVAFPARYSHSSAVFDNKMWVIGGHTDSNSSSLNDVWYSQDGALWFQATASAAFSPRGNHATVVFANKMWIIGGWSGGFLNDVWSSSDGVTWRQETAEAEFPARYHHSSVVFGNKIWVIGGLNAEYLDDVWSSSDGVHWTQAAFAQFPARFGATSLVFQDKMWIIGGWTGERFLNDVWSSPDGVIWTAETTSAEFSARYKHSSLVFGEKMWVIGGRKSRESGCLNDVWSSTNGATWNQETVSAAFPARLCHTSIVFGNKMWVIAAEVYQENNEYSVLNDVWCSSDGATWVPPTHTITLPGGVPLDLMRIPSGSFQMGSNDDSDWSYCNPCEQPVHAVTFSQPFLMGKYEITQAQWLAIMGGNPSYFQPPSSEDLNRPVEQVSWTDITGSGGYLEQLDRHLASSGQGLCQARLPSEAEWEYACRAGTSTRFFFGNSDCSSSQCGGCELDDYAWYCGNSSDTTHLVGQKRPNDYGLYDMHGNIDEWCQDSWHNSYDRAPSDGSAWVTPSASSWVFRGGDWLDSASNCRSTPRYPGDPSKLDYRIGFRLALNTPPPIAPIVFYDGDFNPHDWDVTVFKVSPGGEMTQQQETTGGNPDQFLRITHTVIGPNGTVTDVHLRKGAVYNPQTQGSIDSIAYWEDAICFSNPGGDCEAAGLVLLQDGVYYTIYFVTPFSDWTPKSFLLLRPKDFSANNSAIGLNQPDVDPGKLPNFSASGSEIQFGFFRANSYGNAPGEGTIEGGIDNWMVKINRAGVRFTQCPNAFAIDRDYDQSRIVTIRNDDSAFHNVYLDLLEPPPADLMIGFTGAGSKDTGLVTLAPGESLDARLMIHAADALQSDYSFTARLHIQQSDGEYTNLCGVNIHVLPPKVNFSFEQVSMDEHTRAARLRVTNHQEPIRDLKIFADENLRDLLVFQPGIEHASLESQGVLELDAIPDLNLLREHPEHPLSGNVYASAAGTSRTLFLDFSCLQGNSLYSESLQNQLITARMQDWYCTNKPAFESYFNLPSGFGCEDITKANLAVYFDPYTGWEVQPHNVRILLNGTVIAEFTQTIPAGPYEFEIPLGGSCPLNLPPAGEYGVASNTIRFEMFGNNPGHYIVATDFQVALAIRQTSLTVCAESQEAADQYIHYAGYYSPQPSWDIASVEILDAQDQIIANCGQINRGAPYTIRVTANEVSQVLYVVARPDNGDTAMLLDPIDRGVYEADWTPINQGDAGNQCTIHAYAGICHNGEASACVTLLDGPIAPDFEVDPANATTTTLCAQFTDRTINGPPVSWKWDFGDGATSTDQHPMHCYRSETPQCFTVSLTVNDGHEDKTITKPNAVCLRLQPTATPRPTVTAPWPTASPTASPSPTESPIPTASLTPTESPTPSPSPEPTPARPHGRPVLHVELDQPSVIPGGGEVTYKYEWTSSGGDAPVVHGLKAETEDLLRASDGGATFDVGETWTVTVTPYTASGKPGPAFSGRFIIETDGVRFTGWIAK